MLPREITKLNIAHELTANRYLLTVLLTEMATLSDTVGTLLQKERKENRKEKGSHTLLKEKKKEKKERDSSSIEFEFFKVSCKSFNALVNQYGYDIVIDACSMLDKMCGTSGKSWKRPAVKLREICESYKTRETLSSKVNSLAKTIRKIDIKNIETKEDAFKYIFSVPSYLRNVDKNCIELAKRFEISIGETK